MLAILSRAAKVSPMGKLSKAINYCLWPILLKTYMISKNKINTRSIKINNNTTIDNKKTISWRPDQSDWDYNEPKVKVAIVVQEKWPKEMLVKQL